MYASQSKEGNINKRSKIRSNFLWFETGKEYTKKKQDDEIMRAFFATALFILLSTFFFSIVN